MFEVKKSVLFVIHGLISAASFFLLTGFSAPVVSRPPQFVVFAFDGSRSVPMWQETQKFASDMNQYQKPLKFTYFINAAYYLTDPMVNHYQAPRMQRGRSAIGFGGSAGEVRARYDQTNLAFTAGHEIANHAAGHYDGSQWTKPEWESELTQFYDLLFNIFSINGIHGTRLFPSGWAFNEKDIIGFRAPQLGLDSDMFQVLPSKGLLYDTSRTSAPNVWPIKSAAGTWLFPLGIIKIAGTARKTLSMDYNFYYVQSGAQPAPADKSKAFEDQMYQSYLQYFQDNFNGNRAPVHIGHHFSKWNNGAYWEAMKHFARTVCANPEVKCVTYKELLDFVETAGSNKIALYQRGQFAKAAPLYLVSQPPLDIQLEIRTNPEGRFEGHVSGVDAPNLISAKDLRIEFALAGKVLKSEELNVHRMKRLIPKGRKAILTARMLKGPSEIQSASVHISHKSHGEFELKSDVDDLGLISDPPEAHQD